MYMLYHTIWFTSHGVHSQSGVTPGATCPQPENETATRLHVLSSSVLQQCGSLTLDQASLPVALLSALVVPVLAAVLPGFHVSNLLLLLLAGQLGLLDKGGFYEVISSTHAGP